MPSGGAGTWAGSYTIEVAGPTPYLARNGVRSIVDLTVDHFTLNAPLLPANSASFSVWWTNPNRNTLTIDGNGNPLQDISGNSVAVITTQLLDGIIGFVWSGSKWLISDFNPFDVPLAVRAGVTFTPRDTNGPCTIDDAYNISTVDRTGIGEYIATGAGVDMSAAVAMPVVNAVGLAGQQKAEAHIAARTSTFVEVLTGRRNQGGAWQDLDLNQNPANRVSLFVVKLA